LAGHTYARIVAQVELRRDPRRSEIAVERLMRWRNISRREALTIYRTSLVSEAQEEADSARFMRDEDAFARWLPANETPAIQGPVLFASLHLGSPVLGFLYLRSRCPLDVRAIVRNLDDANPMLTPKRQWGERKIAWVRDRAGGGIIGADATAVAEARQHLLDGQAIFAAVDIPGDVVSRTADVRVCGELLRFSSGIVRLAALTRSTVVPMVALGGGTRMRVHFGSPIAAYRERDALQAVFAELVRFIDRFPGEWWMWPFVRSVPLVDRGEGLR
jgi:hypothetical protein